MPSPAFQRKQAPLPMRLAFGLFVDGILAPVVWTLEKFGRADRVFRAMHKRQLQAIVKHPPFGNYVPNGRDVVVAVYVKSGTNWTMQIAHQLLNHGKAEFDHIHSVVAWPDIKNVPPMRGYAVPLEDESAWRASPEQKRVIKTHLNWDQLPYSESARYILVIRDPKDVFVSSYFFFGNVLGMARPSVDTWFKLFLSDDFLMGGSWAANAAGYWAQRHRPNVLVLSFKSMKRDLHGTVRKIADFLNVRAGEDAIEEVCRKSTFDYMKSIDEKFGVWKQVPWRSETPMMRKGTQGGSSELLSPERQREMDEYFMAELKRLGSDLPYEQFCDVTPKGERAGAA